jgi:hypothetical protein
VYRRSLAILLGVVLWGLLPAHGALAAPTKEECLSAHGRAQDQRQAGHLLLAASLFELCNQPACPALVQADCAQFSEELSRLVPSVSFAARDGNSNDLPDTTVYVDDRLVARRLDDGKAHELDPGSHRVRFVHAGQSETLKVVINQGEQGRTLTASFASVGTPRPATSASRKAAKPPAAANSKSPFPLVLAGVGGAALVTGGILLGVGLGKVPSNCSLGTKECQAPPGDKSLDDAHSAVTLVNIGATTAIAGAIIGIGGLVWYLSKPSEQRAALPMGSRGPLGGVFTF